MDEKEFGAYLKKLRKDKGFTLAKLNEISGVSQPFLSQIERGDRKPSPEILQKLSEPLGVQHSDLMELYGYIEELSDIEKLNQAIQRVQSNLYQSIQLREVLIRKDDELTRKSEGTNDEELKRLKPQIVNNEKYINAWNNSLQKLNQLLADVKHGRIFENLTMIIHPLINPKIELEFEEPDLSKLSIPELDKNQYDSLKNAKHEFTFTFTTPASKENTINGNNYVKPIPRKIAKKSFFDIEILLYLDDDVNFKGIPLNDEDKQLIINTLEDLKEKFTHYKNN